MVVCHPGVSVRGKRKIPKKNPINAKGIAKIVCENFIKER